jgi:hypothetical protein
LMLLHIFCKSLFAALEDVAVSKSQVRWNEIVKTK